MLVYDEDERVYRMTRNKPLEYTPTDDVKKVMAVDSSYAMSEPVALTAADLSDVTNKDYLFLEGAVLSFLPGRGGCEKGVHGVAAAFERFPCQAYGNENVADCSYGEPCGFRPFCRRPYGE